MKNKELIEPLKRFDLESPVYIGSFDNYGDCIKNSKKSIRNIIVNDSSEKSIVIGG